MSDYTTEILPEIEKCIISGDSCSALKKIISVLDSKSLTKQTKLSYQILKARALTQSDDYFHATSVLDDIEDGIFKIGTDYQKLDFFACKIENLLIFGKTDLGMKLINEAENLIEKITKDVTDQLIHKKIDLLILKSHMISNIYGYIDKLHEILELCLQFCNETNYDYGKAKTLERMADSFAEMGEKDNASKCVNEAYDIWAKLENKRGIAYTTFLKGLFLSSTKPDSALDLLNKALKLSKELDSKLTISKVHNSLAILLFQKDEGEEALEHLELSINIKREIGDKHGLILLLYNIGQLYISMMENEKALTYLHEGLAFTKEIDYQRPYYLIQFALNTLYIRRGELNRALRFLEEAVNFYEEKNMKENVAWTREKLADVLILRGDLDNALQNYLLSQEFYEKEKRIANICDVQIKIAEIYQLKGDYTLALSYYITSEKLAISKENYFILSKISYNLITYHLELDQIEEAKSYLDTLMHLNKKLKSKKQGIMTNLAKALVMIKTQKPQEREEAKGLLKVVITEENIEQKFISTAILNLCEILLAELRETEDLELLKELKSYVERLHKEGSAELAYPLLVHSIWLQANVAIIELDVDKARRLLKSAQVMAEAKEMHNLARRISNNHDTLLGQLERWDDFTMKLPNIAERMELTHIESVLNEMIKGKGIIYPEDRQEKEEPILVSIFTAAGSVLYIERIDPDIEIEMIEEIWVSLLKNIKEEEIKAGVVERKKLRDYTYVVKKMESLVFCYIFVGHSYEAIKKMEEFSQLVYGTVEVWEELEEFSKVSLTDDFDVKTLVSVFTEKTSLEYSSNITLNQYVDNIFL